MGTKNIQKRSIILWLKLTELTLSVAPRETKCDELIINFHLCNPALYSQTACFFLLNRIFSSNFIGYLVKFSKISWKLGERNLDILAGHPVPLTITKYTTLDGWNGSYWFCTFYRMIYVLLLSKGMFFFLHYARKLFTYQRNLPLTELDMHPSFSWC